MLTENMALVSNLRSYKSILLASIFIVFWIYFIIAITYQKFDSKTDKNSWFSDDGYDVPEKIVIATVACGKNGAKKFYEETSVMIKSVVISAKNYNLRNVDIHVFIEQGDKSEYILNQLKDVDAPGSKVNVNFYFHSAKATIPEKYHEHMLYHKRFRCGYVRSFFPTALPDVDSLIYLDTDIIITGDVTRLWKLLGLMDKGQMISIGRNNEPGDTNYKDMDQRLFGDIPHVPPKGVNNGVIVMNLTRLREFGWVEKFTQLYDDYSKIKKLTVQRLMNILLFYNPEILQIIPCELHFIHTHCARGPTCKNLERDDIGIHLVHGANHTFEPGGIFRYIYRKYKEFNLTTDDYFENLVEPIRKGYGLRTRTSSKCPEVLSKHLNKNYPSKVSIF